MRYLIYIGFYIILLSLSCELDKDPHVQSLEPDKNELMNTLWTLESFNVDGKIIKPPKDQCYTIQFKDDSTVLGKNDCNDIVGIYTLETGGKINFTKLGTTFANCGDKSMFREYYSALEQVYFYEIIDKNKLILRYDEDKTLTFISSLCQSSGRTPSGTIQRTILPPRW